MEKIRLVTDYMTSINRLITFTPEQNIMDAINLMLKHKITGAPVLNRVGDIIGIISEKDCLKVILKATYYNDMPGKVEDYMSTSVTSVDEDKNVEEVAEMFIDNHFKRFPVVDKRGRLIGQVSRYDILRATQDIKATTWGQKSTTA
ncbi:MAG: CBS domain-containing protein [Thermonemataceae bacterium]